MKPTYAELIAIFENSASVRSIGLTEKRIDVILQALRTAESMPVKVHHFDSTGEAYDACQCREDIKNGDVLIIPSEFVVGIADTWPVAVTEKSGHLHTLVEGATLEEHFADKRRSLVAIPLARAFAQTIGGSND